MRRRWVWMGRGLLFVCVALVFGTVAMVVWARRDRSDKPKVALGAPGVSVPSIIYNPDGRHLAAASGDKIAIWDRASRELVQTLSVDTDRISSIAYSPDGTRLVSGGYSGHVIIWEMRTGQPERILEPDKRHPDSVLKTSAVCFSRDGRTIASSHIASLSDTKPGEVRIWDSQSGEMLRRLIDHESGVLAVAFSPDGRALVSTESLGEAKLWDPATGTLLRKLPKRHAGWHVAFSLDGQFLAYGGLWSDSLDVVTLWNRTRGDTQSFPGGERNGHHVCVDCLAFSPDSKSLAIGETAKYQGPFRPFFQVRVFDVATGELTGMVLCNRRIYSLAFAPDGSELAVGQEDDHQSATAAVHIFDYPLPPPRPDPPRLGRFPLPGIVPIP